jgi:hypothetical protein
VADTDGLTHPYLGASPGCWAIHGEITARWASHAAWPLAVDAYAVQHPGVPERRSSQSVWVHLVSLCQIGEHGWSPAMGISAKQRLLAHQRTWGWLEPPVDPGPVTILDLLPVTAPGVFATEVRRWGEAIWEAWSSQRSVVRARTQELLRAT